MKELITKIRTLLLSRLSPEDLIREFPGELGHLDTPEGRSMLATAIGRVVGKPHVIVSYGTDWDEVLVQSTSPDLVAHFVRSLNGIEDIPEVGYGMWLGMESKFRLDLDVCYPGIWDDLEKIRDYGWICLSPEKDQWYLPISERQFVFREGDTEKRINIPWDMYKNPSKMREEMAEVGIEDPGDKTLDELAFLLAEARFNAEHSPSNQKQ